jgi:hypothetical protein
MTGRSFSQQNSRTAKAYLSKNLTALRFVSPKGKGKSVCPSAQHEAYGGVK